MPSSWKPRSTELVDALRTHYLPPGAMAAGTDEWSFLTEVPSLGAPVADPQTHPFPAWDPDGDPAAYAKALQEAQDWTKTVRNIDVLLMRNWRSGRYPFERIAVEIKISRADFFRDTAAKRAPWQALSHRFAYCVPRGLVAPEEVPDGCWLIEVDEEPCTPAIGRVHANHAPTRVHWHTKVRGARRTPPAIPHELAVHLGRMWSRATETLRLGEGSAAAAQTAEALRKALARVQVLEQREYVNRRRVTEALELVAPFGKQVCANCAEPIRPSVDAQTGTAKWVHRTRLLEQACGAGRRWHTVEPASVRVAREEQYAEEHDAATEAAQWRDERRAW